jgi:uncharacterized membrane protein (Fun14 family)
MSIVDVSAPLVGSMGGLATGGLAGIVPGFLAKKFAKFAMYIGLGVLALFVGLLHWLESKGVIGSVDYGAAVTAVVDLASEGASAVGPLLTEVGTFLTAVIPLTGGLVMGFAAGWKLG